MKKETFIKKLKLSVFKEDVFDRIPFYVELDNPMSMMNIFQIFGSLISSRRKRDDPFNTEEKYYFYVGMTVGTIGLLEKHKRLFGINKIQVVKG